ncbi:conserved hypothetical protein [Mycolicibacterium smegmatis MC2 155]|uniref:Uncharacterized protein n=1 Tax=Mycolicibacterium smegmatis (strain ATCC 700084 / mc(2)155) TaxID=246196 RepID=A0R0D2_MYCS2|nr:conserved hypothetical protein [Mycolicibacterium smegmatis MC2 155]
MWGHPVRGRRPLGIWARLSPPPAQQQTDEHSHDENDDQDEPHRRIDGHPQHVDVHPRAVLDDEHRGEGDEDQRHPIAQRGPWFGGGRRHLVAGHGTSSALLDTHDGSRRRGDHDTLPP